MFWLFEEDTVYPVSIGHFTEKIGWDFKIDWVTFSKLIWLPYQSQFGYFFGISWTIDTGMIFYHKDGRENVFGVQSNEANNYDKIRSFRLKKITNLKKFVNKKMYMLSCRQMKNLILIWLK